MGSDLASRIAGFVRACGEQGIASSSAADGEKSRYTRSVTGFSADVGAVVYPESTEQVRVVVRLANDGDIPVYPVSIGLNWGYGSRCPSVENAVVVDLSRMNSIRNADEVSVKNPVLVIEPGVTQQQVFDFLEANHPGLTFNVSGAGTGTSILGNSLERGVGYLGPRREDLFGLEVVTGRGDILRTGFRRLGEQSPLAHAHPYGLGPMTDGLFFQGNFGIVTSACFRLFPKRPANVAVSLRLKSDEQLGEFIDLLAELKRDGVLHTVTHLANQARTHSSLFQLVASYFSDRCGFTAEAADAEAALCLNTVVPDKWSSLAGVSGTRASVAANIFEIWRRTRKVAGMKIVSDGMLRIAFAVFDRFRQRQWARFQAAVVSAVLPLHGLAMGRPTDAPIDNLLYKYGALGRLDTERLDESDCGLIFVNPALPLDGRLVEKVVRDIERIASDAGFEVFITLNVEGPTTLVGVINLLFNRSDSEQQRSAQALAADLLECIHGYGLSLYRSRVDLMSEITREDDPYWQTIYQLKTVFDPNDIISPGRYNLSKRAG